MASLNKVLLLGNLTRDPELRSAKNGTAIAHLALAVNSRYRQNNVDKEDTLFIDVVTFGRLAETASEYLEKGRPVLIEGRLQWQSWTGQDGQKHSKHAVLADRIQFLGTRSPEESAVPEAGDEDVPY
jgi:single-strand DNA-binding protein